MICPFVSIVFPGLYKTVGQRCLEGAAAGDIVRLFTVADILWIQFLTKYSACVSENFNRGETLIQEHSIRRRRLRIHFVTRSVWVAVAFYFFRSLRDPPIISPKKRVHLLSLYQVQRRE